MMYSIRMDGFSRYQITPEKLKFRKKNWTSFPVIGLAHDQKIEISKKMDDLSRNRSESTVVDSPP